MKPHPSPWDIKGIPSQIGHSLGQHSASAAASRARALKRGLNTPAPTFAVSINTEKADRAEKPRQKARAL